MQALSIIKREMTPEEFKRMNAGFEENAIDHEVAIQSADRFSYTAVDQQLFIGCSSGLAYKNGETYNGWFYLTDLFVEKAYRSQGLGAKLLRALEDEIRSLGIGQIWTWTAGYEAPGFYLKQDYQLFAQMENWYSDGSSRVGLRKKLSF
ncbi:MAG: GNAT family N-acetyltransferase [Bacteroidota bacterium]